MPGSVIGSQCAKHGLTPRFAMRETRPDPSLLKPEYLAKLAFSAEQMATLQKLGEHKGKQELFT
ncbi:hypothetical protein JYT23_01470, partial [Mariprofundus ferrooxydans]|nr:hypothetical protein [Mariprofundus ferrooxydans]